MSDANNTLSLYFGLHEGRKADLEIVAKAAIEWVNSIRHASNALDPSLDVRVEFIDAHESSLSINTIIDWSKASIEKTGKGLDKTEELLERLANSKHPRLKTLAMAFGVFLIIDFGPTIEFHLGEPDALELSEQDRDLLHDVLKEISKSEELKRSNRRFFNALSNDSAISSVGVCEAPKESPIISVPSSQFAERGGLWSLEKDIVERVSERTAEVILEMPNLSAKDRKWRFLDVATDETFTAKMRDNEFIQSLADGKVDESLRNGITMEVNISFKEVLEDGEWVSVPSTIEVTKVTL